MVVFVVVFLFRFSYGSLQLQNQPVHVAATEENNLSYFFLSFFLDKKWMDIPLQRRLLSAEYQSVLMEYWNSWGNLNDHTYDMTAKDASEAPSKKARIIINTIHYLIYIPQYFINLETAF